MTKETDLTRLFESCHRWALTNFRAGPDEGPRGVWWWGTQMLAFLFYLCLALLLFVWNELWNPFWLRPWTWRNVLSGVAVWGVMVLAATLLLAQPKK